MLGIFFFFFFKLGEKGMPHVSKKPYVCGGEWTGIKNQQTHPKSRQESGMISETEVQKKPPVQDSACPSVHTSYPGASITLSVKTENINLARGSKTSTDFIPTNAWNWSASKGSSLIKKRHQHHPGAGNGCKKSSLRGGLEGEMKLNLPTSINNAIKTT